MSPIPDVSQNHRVQVQVESQSQSQESESRVRVKSLGPRALGISRAGKGGYQKVVASVVVDLEVREMSLDLFREG